MNRTRQVLIAALLVCASCTSSAPTDEGTVASWDCIEAQAATGLSTGSTVEQARANLEALIAAPSSNEWQVDYFRELLTALDGMGNDELIGDELDGVECNPG